MKRLLFGAVLGLATLAAVPASADESTGVAWDPGWPRVRPIEVGLIFGTGVGSFLVDGYVPFAAKPHWEGPILFDVPVRKLLRGRDFATQQFGSDAGDFIYKWATLAPYLVDNYLVALGIHQDPDVAMQMTLMDLQSLGLSGVVTLGAEHLVGRARPYTRDCEGPDNAPHDAQGRKLFNACGDPKGDNLSFYSGHVAAVGTMAALTCVHHQHLPLYGGGAPDALVCYGMIGATVATGVFRLMADRHYVSDVLVGGLVATLSGYVLPSWLHYGFGSGRSRPVMRTAMGNEHLGYVMPTPISVPGGAGLGAVGIF
jgi:membrane-associated phospholipid phosphatase